MKNTIITLSLVSVLFNSKAQETKSFNTSLFNRIKASGASDVKFTTADSFQVFVKTTAKQFDNVDVSSDGDLLIIKTKGSYRDKIEFFVKAPNLKTLEISGASSFKTLNNLKTDSIECITSGASNVRLDLENKYISTSCSGASDIKLIGTTNYLSANVSGASSLKSYSLAAKEGNVIASGASSAKIFITDKLMANATGASSIRVKGNPSDIKANASGSSSVSKVLEDGSSVNKSNSSNLGDTTVINWKTKKILIIAGANAGDTIFPKKHNDEDGFKHWVGFSMGVNGYMANGFNTSMESKYKYMDLDYSRSLNFQFNILEHQFKLYKNYVKLNTGFGFDYHIYALNNKTTLNADSSFTWGKIDSTNTFGYRRNRFRNTYIQVPLILEFNTSNNPNKSFHIGFGVVGQYLIASRTKQVLTQDGNTFTKVRKDNYNLNPFGAKAIVTIGYKSFTIFGEYSLTELFKPGQGPKLNTFTAGVRLVPFD